MKTVQVLCTDFGDFPVPPDMEAMPVKWRKRGGWPDMRTKVGKKWVEKFNAFTEQKCQEYLAA